jgi:sacsin
VRIDHSPPEIDFDQSERITDRLRDLVRNYPKGLGLFKEFLQNADDAGASKLQIIYDHRHHTGALENSEMATALSPSLLFVNDQTFTDEDFERIQNIGNGGKVRDSNRTGRFGLGFNTCYSVSDHPSLLTADKIAWFDPHQRVFQKGKNARAWTVSVAEKFFPSWLETFSPAGLKPGAGYFSGTAFRLPLRTSASAAISEICDEPFTYEDFISILADLDQVGPPLIIFLRSVNKLEVLEIAEDGTEHLRYQLSTVNEPEVDQNRSILRNLVAGKPEDLLKKWLGSDEQLPVVQYNHSFVLIGIDGIEHNETWAITSGLFRGPNNQLLEDALKVCRHREKAIPWAGAATMLSGTRTDAAPGGLACFLPLPEKVDWPIWLHGWFDLSSNRRGITRSSEVGEANHHRYQWNKSLMEQAVAEAWAMLMKQIAGDAKENEDPYRLWPFSESTDDIDQALINGFYRVAASLPLIRGLNSVGYHWYRPNDGVLDLSQTWHSHLIEPFLAENWSICIPPLEDFVKLGFEKADEKIPSLTPTFLRNYLLEVDNELDIACELAVAPKQMLRNKKWVCSLAKFCSSGNFNSLTNLPLAILRDGLLHTYTACGTVFIDDEDEQIRTLLQALPERLFDAEYQAAIGVSKTFEKINVVNFDLGKFLAYIPEILSKGKPNNLWLCAFFDYLERQDSDEIKRHAKVLKELEVVPDQYGNFGAMGLIETPLIIHNSENKVLLNALSTINIPLIEGPFELTQIIDRFASKHSGFVWRLTPNDIAYNLKDHIENESFNDKSLDDRDNVLIPLLNFLASEKNWLESDDSRLPFLRKLRILPTTSGQRINSEEPNAYIAGSFHPPTGFEGEYQLLDTGENDQWRLLFSSLGIKTLNGRTFVVNALLPAFSLSISNKKCHSLLVWLRDEYQLVARDLNVNEREQLHQLIRNTPILPISGGGLGAPSEVYRPNASEPKKLFGSRARIPDKLFFLSDQDLWNKFFDEFRLPWKPLASDLLLEIHRLVEVSHEKGVSAVRASLKNLIAHISDNWSDLADIKCNDNRTLAETLAEINWLPAVPSEAAKYAAYYPDWQDSLWRPDQIVPSRLANIASSKYPVLDSQEFSEEMAKALRLVTRVTFSDVIEHFAKVRDLPTSTTEVELEMIRRSAYEVYRVIGQQSSVTLAQNNVNSTYISELSEENSVLVANRWWFPSRCFFNIPFSTSWAISIADAFPSSDQFLRIGLERLGVRQTPEPDDWLQMLNDLAEDAEYDVLRPDALNQARLAIRQLRSAPLEWLEDNDVLVPLDSGKLQNASLSLIPDDSRLKKIDCKNSLPLIEDNQDAIDVGRYSGARSLRAELQDRLAVPPKLIENQDFAKKIQFRIRSREFQECLKRIAYEEALAQNDTDPMEVVNDPLFDRPKKLEICITSTIKIESVVNIAGEEVIAFEISDASSFLQDEITYTRLWLKDRNARRRMLDELVRTLCELCKLTDQLRLSRILEKEPEDMSRVLDEDDVAIIPTGRTLYLGDTEDYTNDSSTVNQESFEKDDTSPDQDMEHDYRENQDTFVRVNNESGFRGELHNNSESVPPLGFQYHSGGGNYQKFRAGTQSTNTNILRATDFSKPQSSDQNSPPIEPGHGSSSPWMAGLHNESTRSNQARLRSYVHEREQSDYDNEPAESVTKDIGDAGEFIVMNWEMKAGRTPKKMPINNEGFDIVSEGQDGVRYIEVKSIDGPWSLRGVGVTRAQYDTAIRLGKNWWLYIVEYAKNEARSVVTPIQNPFHLATEFRFDAGWRDFHSNAFTQTQLNIKPEVGAQYERENTTVTILEAFPRGLLWKVKIKLADDSTETVPWSPSWRRV